MPEIPYKPVPSVTPVERRTPGISVAFPRPEFTQSVGAALESLGHSRTVLGGQVTQVGSALASLGGSFEKAGNEIWARASALKQVENETAAIDADVKFMMTSANMSESFLSKTGEAASGGLDAHTKSLEDLRQKIMGSLPNGEARKIFNERSLPTLGRTVFAAARHAGQQGKAAAAGSYKAQFEAEESSLTNQTATGRLTEEQFEEKMAEAKDRYARIAPDLFDEKKGPQLDLALKQLESKYRLAYINGVSKTDVNHGVELLDRYQAQDRVMGAPAMQLRGTLELRQKDTATKVESDKVMDSMKKTIQNNPDAPEPSLEALTKEAQDNLPGYMRDDPTAKQMVADRIRHDWSTYKTGLADRRDQVYQSLTGLLYGKDGKARKEEEIWAANPEARSWFDDLKPSGPQSQASFRAAMRTANKPDNRFDPEVSNAALEKIRGMADHNTETRRQLLDENLFDDKKWQLNKSDRDKALTLREGVKRKPGADIRVPRAWKWMEQAFGADMKALNLYGTTKDEDEIIKAKGSLGTALDAYEATHDGVQPDQKIFEGEIAKQFLKNQTYKLLEPTTWPILGGPPTVEPFFKRAIPSKKKEEFIRHYKAQTGQEPTESEVFRAYQRGLWLDYYQGETTKQGE